MTSAADRYRRWYEYEKDSHAKVLSSLHAAGPEARASVPYQKALDLLGHMVQARRLWLFRFGLAPQPPRVFFPEGITLADVAGQLEDMQRAWSDYLAGLEDTELARTFEYQSLDGGRFRNTIEDILAQLFGHSWYHRGQIAALLRAAGAEPAVTDFVFWAREALPA